MIFYYINATLIDISIYNAIISYCRKIAISFSTIIPIDDQIWTIILNLQFY